MGLTMDVDVIIIITISAMLPNIDISRITFFIFTVWPPSEHLAIQLRTMDAEGAATLA